MRDRWKGSIGECRRKPGVRRRSADDFCLQVRATMIPFGRDEHVRFSPLRSCRRACADPRRTGGAAFERGARCAGGGRSDARPGDSLQCRRADRAVEAGDREAAAHALWCALGTQGALARPTGDAVGGRRGGRDRGRTGVGARGVLDDRQIVRAQAGRPESRSRNICRASGSSSPRRRAAPAAVRRSFQSSARMSPRRSRSCPASGR
jgi:hypothetical protein